MATKPKHSWRKVKRAFDSYGDVLPYTLAANEKELADAFLELVDWPGTRAELMRVIGAAAAVDEAQRTLSPEPVIRFLISRARLTVEEHTERAKATRQPRPALTSTELEIIEDWMARRRELSTRTPVHLKK